jgi:endonuclease/exonuclease/phosphatase family metal-dependent hydrolase
MRWIAIVLLGCSSQVVSETKHAPLDLQVDTYNIGLAGIGVPLEEARRPALLAELSKLKGDFACLQEVWQDSDKAAVISAMRPHYPYAFYADTTLATKVDDVAETAPCVGFEKELDAGVACLASKCQTPDGRVTSLECAVDSCIGDVATLLAAKDKRCYACLAATLPSEKIADIATQCRAPGRGLGFSGQSSQIILSKHPVSNMRYTVLPGCWQQRVVISLTAALPNGANVNVVCNHLSSIDDDDLIPYVCPWGDGTSGKTAWENEQYRQAQRVVASLGSGPTIVLGDFNASPGGYGIRTLGLFSPLRGAPLGKCTFCADNPLTSGEENGWVDHVFVRSATVKSTLRTFDAPSLSAADKMWPLSDHYGVRATITIP